jgi:hypothetical protein
VAADGTAEFSEVTLRGEAAGETVVVGPPTGPQVVIGYDGNEAHVYLPTNTAAETHQATITGHVYSPGTAAERIALQLEGPAVSGGDRMSLVLGSATVDGNWLPHVQIIKSDTELLVNIDASIDLLAPVNAQSLNVAGDLDVHGHTALQSVSGTTLDVTGQVNAAENVAVGGDLSVTGAVHAGATDWGNYVPVISGGGAATFTVREANYTLLGEVVIIRVYFSVAAAGSGTSNVTFDLPFMPVRPGRQAIPGGARDGSVAGAGPVTAMTFAGGSAAQVDRIVNSAGADVTGAMLTAGSIWCFQGWYRRVI